MGTQQLVILFDKKREEVVKTCTERVEDFMHALEQETDVLSGVLCYKRFFGKDNILHLNGRIIRSSNPVLPNRSGEQRKFPDARGIPWVQIPPWRQQSIDQSF